jgi:FtsH-binding integral membrane protein
MDYLCLGAFTLSLGMSIGTLSSIYGLIEIPVVVLLCMLTVSFLAMFSSYSSCGVTPTQLFMLASMLLLTCVGLAAIFFAEYFRRILNAALISTVFMGYLIYEADSMVSPNYFYEICPEEYAFAALNVYVDVINNLAELVNKCSKEETYECDPDDAA